MAEWTIAAPLVLVAAALALAGMDLHRWGEAVYIAATLAAFMLGGIWLGSAFVLLAGAILTHGSHRPRLTSALMVGCLVSMMIFGLTRGPF